MLNIFVSSSSNDAKKLEMLHPMRPCKIVRASIQLPFRIYIGSRGNLHGRRGNLHGRRGEFAWTQVGICMDARGEFAWKEHILHLEVI